MLRFGMQIVSCMHSSIAKEPVANINAATLHKHLIAVTTCCRYKSKLRHASPLNIYKPKQYLVQIEQVKA